MEDKVILTRDEADSLQDFIECGFIEFIKAAGDEIDNMRWVYNIATIWKKCDDMMFGVEEDGKKSELNNATD